MVKTCLFKQRPNIQIQRVMDHKTWYLWIQASERVQHVWAPKTCLQWLARRTKPCTYQTGEQTKCFKLFDGVQTSSNTIKSDQTVNIWPRLNYYLASSLASAFHYTRFVLGCVVQEEQRALLQAIYFRYIIKTTANQLWGSGKKAIEEQGNL